MNKNEWSFEQPLRAIKHVIEDCDGAVVIAFSRYHFPTGMELKKSGEVGPLTDVRLPTIWNQVEAAMAYMKCIPLLVIAERGLRDDGLLEGKYDWNVFWTEFKAEQLRSDAFVGYLESWRRRVVEHASMRSGSGASVNGDISKMTVGELIARLSVPQLWATVSAIFGLLLSVAAAAFRAGSGKWPWQ